MLRKNKSSLDVSLSTIGEQPIEQRINCENKIFRTKNIASKQETRLEGGLANDQNQARKTILSRIILCVQEYNCELSKQQPIIVQCFKCRAPGHIGAICDNA